MKPAPPIFRQNAENALGGRSRAGTPRTAECVVAGAGSAGTPFPRGFGAAGTGTMTGTGTGTGTIATGTTTICGGGFDGESGAFPPASEVAGTLGGREIGASVSFDGIGASVVFWSVKKKSARCGNAVISGGFCGNAGNE